MGKIYQKRSGRSWELRKKSLELWPKWIKTLQKYNKDLIINKPLMQLTTNEEKFEKLKKFVLDNPNDNLQILEKDSDNIDVIAALADYYDHRGDSNSALEIIDSGLEKDDSSLLVRLIKLKLLFSADGTNKNLKKELDNLIRDLVQDSDYQVYKNTSTDDDALWLYSMSEDKK